MNKRWMILLFFFILLMAPTIYRYFRYNSGNYIPPQINEESSEEIDAVLPNYKPFIDEPTIGTGDVLFDLSHNNNLEINDLSVLRDRLQARGAKVSLFKHEGEEDTLQSALRGVSALVVIAPTTPYETLERQLIKEFVADGGRLLLVADPTRPVPREKPQEEGLIDLFTIFFPISAVPSINSLSTEFDLIFFDDYLYNLNENEGNYRNVQFHQFYKESALTQELEKVVFFASYSLQSSGINLITGDDNTQSPLRRGEKNLTAAALSNNEQVLALGDLTFLTAPYHTIADNDKFLSRIADWLVVNQREVNIRDFPYFFSNSIDLIQVNKGILETTLLIRQGEIQHIFEKADRTINLRDETNPEHDVLYIGSYNDIEQVENLLISAGVTISVTGILEEEAEEGESTEVAPDIGSAPIPPPEEELPAPPSEIGDGPPPLPEDQLPPPPLPLPAPPSPTEEPSNSTLMKNQIITGTDSITLTDSITVMDTPLTDTEAISDTEKEEKTKEKLVGSIVVEGLGEVNLASTRLFVVDQSDPKVILIVLAEDIETALDGLNQLELNDFSNCALTEMVTLCSTTEEESNSESSSIESEDTISPDGQKTEDTSIFILSNDDGSEGSRTSAAEFESILSATYKVTVWSMSQDGLPTEDDIAGFDIYIIDSGDYANEPNDLEIVGLFAGVQGGVIFMGEQAFQLSLDEPAPLNDIEVVNDKHPLARGFTQGEIITLSQSESGVPAYIYPETVENASIVLARGPDSSAAGTPILIAFEGETAGQRGLTGGFAFYRLPETAQITLAFNMVEWLTQ